MSEQSFIIVGAGLVGAKAAEAFREYGFDGCVVLIGSESERPYVRPPLSKEYLRGEAGLDKVYVHDESFYESNRIELLSGATAERIDADPDDRVLNRRLRPPDVVDVGGGSDGSPAFEVSALRLRPTRARAQ